MNTQSERIESMSKSELEYHVAILANQLTYLTVLSEMDMEPSKEDLERSKLYLKNLNGGPEFYLRAFEDK